MDTCNGSSAKMMSVLNRVVAELLLQEYKEEILMKGIRRVEQHSWLKLDRLRALVKSPRTTWSAAARTFDKYWKKKRVLDYRLRLEERTADRR